MEPKVMLGLVASANQKLDQRFVCKVNTNCYVVNNLYCVTCFHSVTLTIC